MHPNLSIQYRSMNPRLIHGTMVIPNVHIAKIKNGANGWLRIMGENADRITRLRASGLFDLPPERNFPGDVMRNCGISPSCWFSDVLTNDLFDELTGVKRFEGNPDMGPSLIVASNLGNAPFHEYEAGFDAMSQALHLASKDNETHGRPINKREYFCVTFRPAQGIDIEYVRFDETGSPYNTGIKTGIKLAAGGRPLVYNNKPVPLSEVLATSVSDPRHVILFPEIDLLEGEGRFMPLGVRTIQHEIALGKAEEVMQKIKNGEPVLIRIEEERKYDKDISPNMIEEALMRFGYSSHDWSLSNDRLHVVLKPASYRHTFWAKRDDDIFIGIIGNELPENNGTWNNFLYDRVLKPTGLTIFELQEFLVKELKVNAAVMMGSGKDPRFYWSSKPHTQSANRGKLCDIDARPAITAGLIGLILEEGNTDPA